MVEMNTAAAFCIHEVFNDSYERCFENGDFIDRFCAIFFSSDEVVAQKFAGTDLAKQERMIEAPLHEIMALKSTEPEEAVVVRGHEQRHFAPELYDLWEKSLIETVAECDDQYDSHVKTAWIEVLAGGANIIRSMN